MLTVLLEVTQWSGGRWWVWRIQAGAHSHVWCHRKDVGKAGLRGTFHQSTRRWPRQQGGHRKRDCLRGISGLQEEVTHCTSSFLGWGFTDLPRLGEGNIEATSSQKEGQRIRGLVLKLLTMETTEGQRHMYLPTPYSAAPKQRGLCRRLVVSKGRLLCGGKGVLSSPGTYLFTCANGWSNVLKENGAPDLLYSKRYLYI